MKIQQYSSADKTSLNSEGATLWSSNDKVFVNGVDAAHTVTISAAGVNAQASVQEDMLLNGSIYCLYAGNATADGFDAETRTFTYTMPTSFTYNSSKINAPMVGTNDGNNVEFENICTMLKLQFEDITPSKVVITSDNAIAGQFSAQYSAQGWTVTPISGSNTLTVSTSNNSVIYVPIPAGNHKLSISCAYFKKHMLSTQNLEKNVIYPITCTPHKFSRASSSKKVYFALGNLQYRASTNTWRFAENQWDCCTQNANASATLNDWIDAFARGASGGTYFGVPPYSNTGDYSEVSWFPSIDWAYYLTGGSPSRHWYTLSKEELEYILSTRSNSAQLRFAARIQHSSNDYTVGYVLLPDDFPITNPPCSYISSANYGSVTANTLSEDDWKKFENLGAIFLPMSEVKIPMGSSGTLTWTQKNTYLRYWTTTVAYGFSCYYAHMTPSGSGINLISDQQNADWKMAVRPVLLEN